MPEFGIDNRIGGARIAAASAATLPFARNDLANERQTLVHFKIADNSAQHRLEVAQAVNERMRDVRVNGHSIVAICTDEDVTMSALDTNILAAHITPVIAKALGITL